MSDDWTFSTVKLDNKKNWNFSEYWERGGSLGVLNCLGAGQLGRVHWFTCQWGPGGHCLRVGHLEEWQALGVMSTVTTTHYQGNNFLKSGWSRALNWSVLFSALIVSSSWRAARSSGLVVGSWAVKNRSPSDSFFSRRVLPYRSARLIFIFVSIDSCFLVDSVDSVELVPSGKAILESARVVRFGCLQISIGL